MIRALRILKHMMTVIEIRIWVSMSTFAIGWASESLGVTRTTWHSRLVPITILTPNAAAKETSTTELNLMLLLLQFLMLLLMTIVRWQVTKNFKNRICNWKCSQINIFKSDMFGAVTLPLEPKLASWRKLQTSLTILSKGHYAHIHFILHQEPIYSFLKCNKELKRTKLRTPCVTALITLKFKVGTLNTLKHKEFLSIPLILILNCIYFCKRLLTRPLDLNELARRRQRHILMSIYIVLDLLNISIRRSIPRPLIRKRRLKPISNLKHISRFQLLIIFVAVIVRIYLPNSFQIFPLKYLLVCK